MPVSMCHKCGKMISISNIPGGNPTAKANPEAFALRYGVCDHCNTIFCDKHLEKKEGIYTCNYTCPQCGRKVILQGPPDD